MALTFPAAPANGTTFTASGITWTYASATNNWTGSTGSAATTVVAAVLDTQKGAGVPSVTTKSTGAALADGDIYWDTTNDILYSYSGSAWVVSGSKWTDQTGGISRADKIKVGAAGTPASALDVVGTVSHNPAVTTGEMDLAVGQEFSITPTAATTFSFTKIPAGKAVSVLLQVKNGGAQILTWPANITWESGSIPSLAAAGIDIIIFFTQDGGTSWFGHHMTSAGASSGSVSGGAGWGWDTVVSGGPNPVIFDTTEGVALLPDGSVAFTPFVFGYNNVVWDSTLNAYLALQTSFPSAGAGIAKSTDGITWTASPAGTMLTSAGTGIVSGGGTLVAVGGQSISSSTDGLTWTSRLTGAGSNFQSVTYGGGVFTAVGNTGIVRTSPNGTTWTTRTSGVTTTLWDVAYGAGLFVAVGAGGVIRTSPTGVTWTSRVSGTTDDLGKVIYLGGKFIAIETVTGTGLYIKTSADGITWTTTSIPTQLQNFAYNGTKFVAVGQDANVYESADAANWVRLNSTPISSSLFSNVTWTGTEFIAVGDDSLVYKFN